MGKIVGIIMALMVACPLVGQDKKLSPEKWREFEAQKVAFFTQEMNLSPEEAAVFWPLNNEMQKKLSEQGDKIRKCSRDTDIKTLTEEQAAARIKEIHAAEKAIQEIKEEYYAKLIKAVSAKKVWLMMEAEHKFRHKLWKKVVEDVHPKPKNDR